MFSDQNNDCENDFELKRMWYSPLWSQNHFKINELIFQILLRNNYVWLRHLSAL